MSSPPQGPPPQWGPPPGPPPQWGTPQGAPQYWSQPQGAPGQWPPAGPPSRPPSKNKGLLVLVVAAVALLGVAFVGFRILGGEGGAVSDEQRKANAKTATSGSDFDIVCGNGSVSNAGAYTKPYNSLAFYQGQQDDSWDSVTLEGARGSSELDSINVVACLSRAKGTEVKSGTCEFRTGGKTVNVDHYAVEYDIEVHEAKTGKHIKNLGTVNGPADGCPFMATFDPEHPKLYGNPDGAALNKILEDFEGS